jgi:hypothetical protein
VANLPRCFYAGREIDAYFLIPPHDRISTWNWAETEIIPEAADGAPSPRQRMKLASAEGTCVFEEPQRLVSIMRYRQRPAKARFPQLNRQQLRVVRVVFCH